MPVAGVLEGRYAVHVVQARGHAQATVAVVHRVGHADIHAASASITLTKPRKFTAMYSSMGSPVSCSTVLTISPGPPRPSGASILFMSWPGMLTQELCGRLTTVT